MKLTKEVKDLIRAEYSAFETQMYAGKSKTERDKLAQFFTPPEISIKLIEELTGLTGNVLDPTCGSGNLLTATIIAGADVDKVFGNEYDARMVEACRNRIKTIPDRLESFDPVLAAELRAKLVNFKDWQIHQGNALHEFALTEFGPDYEEYYFDGVSTNTAKAKRLNNVDDTAIPGIYGSKIKEHDYKIYYCNKKFQAEHLDSCKSCNERHKKLAEEVIDSDDDYLTAWNQWSAKIERKKKAKKKGTKK